MCEYAVHPLREDVHAARGLGFIIRGNYLHGVVAGRKVGDVNPLAVDVLWIHVLVACAEKITRYFPPHNPPSSPIQ